MFQKILVEDVKCLLTSFSDSRVEYYNKVINRDADALAKSVHRNVQLYLII